MSTRYFSPPVQIALWACVALFTCGCTPWQSWRTPWTGAALGDNNPVGSTEWWSANKSRAEFVPGQGYRVANVDGYFDEMGRPIDTAIQPVLHEEEVSALDEFKPQVAIDRIKQVVGQGPDETAARQFYEEARQYYHDKDYGRAADRFGAAAARWPNSSLAQDALFNKAESLFFDDQYPEANDAYLKLLTDFPNTPHLDAAVKRQALIARYWQEKHQHDPDWPITPNLLDDTRPKFDTLGHAIRTYENIRLNDPTGPLADDALMATANAYFYRGKYEDADYHYQLLRREYPRSEHQYSAHLLGLQCKLRMYQGPEYDAAPLEQAQRLIKQLRVQFATELSQEERLRVDKIDAQIQKNLAQRDWRMAQFYEGRKEFGAARYYYAHLAENYAGTQLAEQSQTRLAAIAEEPAEPTERLDWLLDYLPESRERAMLAVPPRASPVRR